MIQDKKDITRRVVVSKEEVGERLDSFLKQQADVSSRSFAQNIIEDGLVLVNGKKQSKHYRLKKNDTVVFKIPKPEKPTATPESIPLNIIYEDQNIIVLSKPQGLVVHPAHGHRSGTLVNALLAYTKDLSGIGGVLRPGIIHRLDKDTSGLMAVAKNDLTHQFLVAQLKKRTLKRFYLALVHGEFDVPFGTVDVPIGRGWRDPKKMTAEGRSKRQAVTHFKVCERFPGYALLEVNLETGRTHQIRVHLSYIKHPIVGDKEYGYRKLEKKVRLDRQFLHAYRLEFNHPKTGKKLEFTDDLPEDLQLVLDELRADLNEKLKVKK